MPGIVITHCGFIIKSTVCVDSRVITQNFTRNQEKSHNPRLAIRQHNSGSQSQQMVLPFHMSATVLIAKR